MVRLRTLLVMPLYVPSQVNFAGMGSCGWTEGLLLPVCSWRILIIGVKEW